VREPAGSALPGIAPSNAYPCADGWVLVAGNGDSIFKRLMRAIGRDDLGADPALAGNAGRVARVAEIDAAIGAWTAPRRVVDVLAALNAAAVPVGRIYTAQDIADDPHYRARGLEINPAYKAFLGVSWLFLISTAFTLAKMLRDADDVRRAERAAA